MRMIFAGVVAGAVLAAGVSALPVSATPLSHVGAEPASTRQGAGGPAVPRSAFGWPLPGFPTVLRRFDPPEHPFAPGHRGVDLGGWVGQPVLAAGEGVVAFAGMVADKPAVSIDHPNGLRTTYEPVVATVSAGQLVRHGETIGTLQAGHDGCSAAACLHWGVRRGQEYLNPLWLLSPSRVRLLPNPRRRRRAGSTPHFSRSWPR